MSSRERAQLFEYVAAVLLLVLAIVVAWSAMTMLGGVA